MAAPHGVSRCALISFSADASPVHTACSCSLPSFPFATVKPFCGSFRPGHPSCLGIVQISSPSSPKSLRWRTPNAAERPIASSPFAPVKPFSGSPLLVHPSCLGIVRISSPSGPNSSRLRTPHGSTRQIASPPFATVKPFCTPLPFHPSCLGIVHISSPSAPKSSRLRTLRACVVTNASKRPISSSPSENVGSKEGQDEQEEEVELSWFEEKVEDLVQYTGSVVRAIPGPRVGDGELPWILALPISYVAVSLVIAVVKTVRKRNAPEGVRRRQIGKNALLVASLSEYLPGRRDELDSKRLNELGKKSQFDNAEVLRKYIRYALNERPFDPELVADLIHLRNVSSLDDKAVAEILNEVSRRIVKSKGPVIVDTTGFTEKGLKRKVAVQALFSKILYLSELDEFCSTMDRSSLSIKEIFGVTDEDANLIRIQTLSGESEVESLEKLVETTPQEDLDEEPN